MEWLDLVIAILAAVGGWAHINPHFRNGSNLKWLDGALRFGNVIAGEYRHNKSHPAP